MQSRISVWLHFPVFPGYNIACRKKEFDQVGGFFTKNLTCEDIDLSLKLKKLGRAGYSPKMMVFTSVRRFKTSSIWYNEKNAWKYILFKKSANWQEYIPGGDILRAEAKKKKEQA